MKTNFTNGEWKPEDHRDKGDWRMTGNIFSVTGEFHNRLICRIEPIGNILNEESIKEFHANINLISAAPELYAAAEILENLMSNFGDDFRIETKDLGPTLIAGEMIEKFKKALAKARGE